MLRLHNTMSGAVEPVEPLAPGKITMYSCGPTVYRPVHIGNLRSFMLADVLRRVFAYLGLEPYALMNITDVGHMTDELTDEGRDRMLLAAEDEGLSTSEVAAKYTDLFLADCAAVNIRPFDMYPKASEHVPQIIELVAELLERGHAYEKDGSVYYDVTTFPDYGKLTHQSLEDMQAGHRIEEDTTKRHHQDFVLWVAAGPRRDLVFDSPWGLGYPGWHIECSAMSLHHLGERFDVHTGGVDNRFPHHEDEIAQSEGAVGHPVVGIWVHGEHLLLGRMRMAKSARNVVTIRDVIEAGHDPLAHRSLCFTARYRRQFHYDEDALGAAATGLRRLREQMALLGSDGSAPTTDDGLRGAVSDEDALRYHDRFVAAICDDLDFPTALGVVHEALSDEAIAPSVRWTLASSWDEVLGLGLAGAAELPSSIADRIRERDEARAAGNYARADEIRERLRAEGVDLLDSPSGTRWVRRGRR